MELTITNDGGFDLEVSPMGNEWLQVSAIDSNEPGNYDYWVSSNKDGSNGAIFNWINTDNGLRIPISDDPDDFFTEVKLPWPVTFYGKEYSTMYVTFNGLICFDKMEYQDEFYFGQQVYSPNPNLPNNYLAPGWGYVGPIYNEIPGEEGCFIKAYPDKLVVSYIDYINGFGMGDPVSYQAIFFKNGIIKLQYKVGFADWTLNRLGISAENEDGSKGVQIAFYEDVITDKAAFVLTPFQTHTIAPNQSAMFNVTVNAATLIGGEYQGALKLTNNTPDNSELEIPALLTVVGEAEIGSINSIDLGQVIIQEVLDEYGDEAYKAYYQDFELTNSGKGALVIDAIYMENPDEMATSSWINVIVNDTWGSQKVWTPTTDMWNVAYPITLLPGEKILLRAQVNPTPAQGEISDNLVIESSIGTKNIAVTAKAIMPPRMEFDEKGLTVNANNSRFAESRTFEISNMNGQSDLNVTYELIFDRGQEASEYSAAMMRTAAALSSEEPAVLQMSNESTPASMKSAAYSSSSEERYLSYTDQDRAENFIGFGGTVEFESATTYKAPVNGFNLTDVMSMISLESFNSATITVTILAGKDINASTQLYKQSFEVTRDGEEKAWRRFKLDQNQIMLPGETFHVVFSYPSGIKYPQGITTLNDNYSDKCYYYDINTSRWVDFTTVESFSKRTYLTKAVETEYLSAAWVELAGNLGETIAAGEKSEVTFNFKGAFSQGKENTAYLIARSNDPDNTEVEIPVRMIMNQAPVFQLGNEAVFTTNEDEMLDVTIAVTDEEGDEFTLSNDSKINGLTAVSEQGGLHISYRPSFNDAGSHKFVATATDAHGNSSECNVTIMVNNVNRAPIATSAVTDRSYNLKNDEGYIEFNTAFTDPDGDEMTFAVETATSGIIECYSSKTTLYIKPLALGNTDVTITATDAHGLSTQATFNVMVKNRVGIDELENGEIRVYPIPADDHVFVQWNQLIPGNILVRLNTMEGKAIAEREVKTSQFVGEEKISLAGLPSGIYFIEIVSEKDSIIKRIIKK